jgi:hypothetical protein
MTIVLTTFLPPALALILGATLALRRPAPLRDSLPRILQGLLLVFALGYVVSVQNDHYYWRTYWPDTPLVHALGPDWATDLLRAALGQFKLSGPLFLGAFLATALLRRGKAA